MILDVYVEDQHLQVEVPQEVLDQGEDFFAMMDNDMDKGWKMGPSYIENPDAVMRAQIAAGKMMTAIDTENKKLLSLMAGYIVSRVPGVTGVRIADGDPLSTEIIRE